MWVASVGALYPAYRQYFRELGLSLRASGIDPIHVLARAASVAIVLASPIALVGTLVLVAYMHSLTPRLDVLLGKLRPFALPITTGLFLLYALASFTLWLRAGALGERVRRDGDAPSGLGVNTLLDVHTFAVVVSPLGDDQLEICAGEQEWAATLVAESDSTHYVLLRPTVSASPGSQHPVVLPLSKDRYAVIRVRGSLSDAERQSAAWQDCRAIQPSRQD